MSQVNPDTLIQLPGGQWIAAGLAGPTVNGKVSVNNDTVIRLPAGGTMVAGAIGYSAPSATLTAQPAGAPQAVAPTPTPTPTTNPALAGGAASARSLLRTLGLEELFPFAEQIATGQLTMPELLAMLSDHTSAPGQVVDRIYPELRETRENGLPAISIQNVLDARTTARQVVNQLGVQDAFPDLNATVRSYLTNGKSIAELQARLVSIGDAVTATAYGDPAHQQELAQWQQYYGVSPTKGELVAMALNSQFTVAQLQERAQTAKIGAAGVSTGFGQIDRTQAEGIAALGVTGDQAIGQFSQLAGIQPAVGELTGQQVDVVGQQAQLDAAFGGNAQAQRRIAKRQREQEGLFSGGGGFASGSEGFAVGSAR